MATTKKVFDFSSYRDFLRHWIRSRPNGGRGARLAFAKAVKCHSAYITFVLDGRADFTLEQSSLLSEFLQLDPEEKHFFFLLVQLARAGNPDVRQYFSEQITVFLTRRSNLKNRPDFKNALSEQHQAVYYSSWHYAAIHVAVAARDLQTREALAKYFRIPVRRAAEVLRFLTGAGLIKEVDSAYQVGTTSIHLGNDSPMIAKHHTNWRLRALQNLDAPAKHDLHYSSVVMMSKDDVPKARAILVNAIEEIRAVVRASPEEHCYSYGADLFRVAAE